MKNENICQNCECISFSKEEVKVLKEIVREKIKEEEIVKIWGEHNKIEK